jgi:hypothetical protein
MSPRIIDVRPVDDDARRLWEKVGELAREFGVDQRWCLVGGLMVQLYAYEHAASPRATSDIDVLADARARPSMTRRLAEQLDELGADLADPPVTDPNLGYQFKVDDQIVEILGPDGLKAAPRTLGKYETIEVPGGSQALNRTETVTIAVEGGSPTEIRRPTLLGAILLKARALKVHKRREDQRQDLILLLSFVEDPRSMADELRRGERKWLRDARTDLRLDDPLLQDRFSDEQLRLVRLALEILAPTR